MDIKIMNLIKVSDDNGSLTNIFTFNDKLKIITNDKEYEGILYAVAKNSLLLNCNRNLEKIDIKDIIEISGEKGIIEDKYKQMSERIREKEEFEASILSKNKSCNYVDEIVFLTNKIPDWEKYFNEYQIQITKLFLSYKNVSDIANLLNKPYASVYSALFSKINNEQGIFGKLKNIYTRKINDNTGIGEAVIQRKAAIEESIEVKILDDFDLKQRLLKLIEELPNWRENLNEYQIKVMELYLIHNSFSKVDKIIGKKSCWTMLFGQTKLNPKGIYKKLENEYIKQKNKIC